MASALLANPDGAPPGASLDALRAAMPAEPLFAGREWLASPQPLRLERKFVKRLERLGHQLLKFQQAADLLYHQSVRGRQPEFIARMLDAGKPPGLLELARAKPLHGQLPRVIRPDILVGDNGIAIAELDAVPGGIGLTAWLNQTYAALGHDPLGGADGMLDGFASIMPGGGIHVSPEAATYRPEMEWLAARLNQRAGARRYSVRDTGHYVHREPHAYRFFELFDLPNLECADPMLRQAAAGELDLTPPPKPWIEEKMWLAFLHLRPLAEFWRRELGSRYFHDLLAAVPRSLPVDPQPLPPHAVLPVVGAHSWSEVARFSQRERELILKLSGFSERAWGSRGVVLGSDVPHDEWAAAVESALDSFPHSPYLLQEFRHTAVVEHPYYERHSGALRSMRGRVRLCPYYFVGDGRARLGGVLATICPADKKLIHGMSDAIICPCAAA